MKYQPHGILPKDFWLYQKALPGTNSIPNNPFMAALSHNGMASGTYNTPDISKQVTFQDSALLCGLQKINKMLKHIDNNLYALTAEKNESSIKQYKSQGMSNFGNRKSLRNSSMDSSSNSQDRERKPTRRPNGLKSLGTIQVID